MTDIWPSTKTKMTRLINKTCFWSWPIEKKGKLRTCNIKTNVETHSAWYMNRNENDSVSLLIAKETDI